MARAHLTGELVGISADRPKVEYSTFTCKHCNKVVWVPAGQGATARGGWCGRCAAPICFDCGKLGRCTPFEARLERDEARDRMLRSILGS